MFARDFAASLLLVDSLSLDRDEMRSLPVLMIITVLFSTTPYLDPLRQSSPRRRLGETKSVTAPSSCSVELSPSPSKWKSLNPEVRHYVLGSAHVSVDRAIYQDEGPLRPEFLDPLYVASKLLCVALVLFLMGVAAVLLITIEYCVCSYLVNRINPLHISYDLQEFPSVFFDPPPTRDRGDCLQN